MKEFQHLGIVQQPLQIGRAGLAAGDLNELGVAVAPRKLDKAQPITLVVEAQRLGVYRDAGAEVGTRGEVALMQSDGHRAASLLEGFMAAL